MKPTEQHEKNKSNQSPAESTDHCSGDNSRVLQVTKYVKYITLHVYIRYILDSIVIYCSYNMYYIDTFCCYGHTEMLKDKVMKIYLYFFFSLKSLKKFSFYFTKNINFSLGFWSISMWP